jgi:hypothetical protein
MEEESSLAPEWRANPPKSGKVRFVDHPPRTSCNVSVTIPRQRFPLALYAGRDLIVVENTETLPFGFDSKIAA